MTILSVVNNKRAFYAKLSVCFRIWHNGTLFQVKSKKFPLRKISGQVRTPSQWLCFLAAPKKGPQPYKALTTKYTNENLYYTSIHTLIFDGLRITIYCQSHT